MEPTKKEFFVIIDGNAILHRAFHALPPLTSKDGKLANAVYGFFSMFLKIIEDLKPSYIVVCFDRPKPTFRKTLYVGYQAHRPKMDDGLASQIEVLHEILEKAGIEIFEIDGYEADDLIGTIVDKAQNSNLKTQNHNSKLKTKDISDGGKVKRSEVLDSSEVEVIIVSGDRDMLQLVNSHVKVLAPIVGMTKMILFDEEKVEEKYGLKPTQIIDYKALVGDASDNYPGVSGIGPKTARDLLQKFGSLEEIYAYLNEFGSLPHVANDARQTHSKNQPFPRSLSESGQQSNIKNQKNSKSAFSSFASGETSSSKSESSFSCLENGLAHNKDETSSLSSIPPKIAEKLLQDAEQAALAKKLATIVTDAPLTLDMNKCSIIKFNKKGLVEEFEKLGLKSLIKRVMSTDDFVEENGRRKQKSEKTDENEQLDLL